MAPLLIAMQVELRFGMHAWRRETSPPIVSAAEYIYNRIPVCWCASTDDCLRELAYNGEFVTKVAILIFRTRPAIDCGRPAAVGNDVAVLYIDHVTPLDERVIEVLVGGIEGVVDFERAEEISGDTGAVV